MKQSRKSLCWPGMEANFHCKHSLNENNHLGVLFHNADDRTRQSHSHVISSSPHRIQRRAFKEQEATNPKHTKRGFCPFLSAMRVDRFRLPCGHGWRTAFRCDAFCQAVDWHFTCFSRWPCNRRSKVASEISFFDQLRRSCFRANKQIPTLYTLMYTPM